MDHDVRPDLSEAILASSDLRGANLGGADLERADLSHADLTRANFTDANLFRANLAGADLTGAILKGTHLQVANLTGANLTDADMKSADLSSAILVDAILTKADLRGAVLGGADMTGAHVHGARVSLQQWSQVKRFPANAIDERPGDVDVYEKLVRLYADGADRDEPLRDSLALFIDPGRCSTDDIQLVLSAINDLHLAAGGLGFHFESGDAYVLARLLVGV